MTIFQPKSTPANRPPDEINQIDLFVADSPSFSDGDAVLTNYIVNDVVTKELHRLNVNSKYEFTPEKAEVTGRKHGVDEGTHYDYQTKCRNAYRETIQRVRSVLSAIVKREKDEIYKAIREELPNMGAQLEQKLNRNEVEKLTEIAEKRNKADRKAEKFLLDRGLDINSPEAQDAKGYTNWKFWVPLLVILLIELFANYLFLNPATPLDKILISVTAVVVVFVCGFGINTCRKKNAGIRTADAFKKIKNTFWHLGVVFFGVFFTLALLFFISYRAGKSFVTTEIFSQLTTAFTNNITDFGLAVLNVVFLFIAITTFRNATYRVSGYDKLASERRKRTRGHKQIRGRLYNQSRVVFDEAHDTINLRRNASNKIGMNWRTIKDTCDHIPDIERDATNRIADQYESAIKKYREGFEKGRFPNAENREDMRTEIPAPIRVSSSIDTLIDDDESLRQQAAFNQLSSINFEEEIDQFSDRVENWRSANEKFDQLNEFARKLIKKHQKQIVQEMQDDGATNLIEKTKTVSDE